MFKPRKVGWSDQGQTDLHESGENCLKYFKRGQKRTEGRGHKDFKKEGQAGSMDECLKKGGGWVLESPYELCLEKRPKLAKGSREVVSEGPKVLHICFCSFSNNST